MGLVSDVELLAVLVEPQRRRVYDELAASAQPRTLTDLAAALELGRTLTSFHLVKLVEAGFVEVLAAKPGDGRPGRPSQRYRASNREVSASVPPRHYDLVAAVLLEAAADQRPTETLEQAAQRVARRRGEARGRQEKAGRRAPLRRAQTLLARLGYVPTRDAGALVLRNCPFDKLRDTNRSLVCGINAALADGYLAGLGIEDQLAAQLRPCPESCCVVVAPR